MTIITISAAVFFVVNLIVIALFYRTTAESAVTARLRGLTPRGAVEAQRVRNKAEMTALHQVLVSLGQVAFRRNEKSLTHRLITAGMRNSSALPLFLGIRTLFSFGPAIIMLAPKTLSGEPLGDTLWYAVGLFFFGHIACNYWLRQKSEARVRAVTEGLPDTLDLLVTCLEAGLGLNAAIQRVGDERADRNDALGRELSQVHAELRAGRPREEALHDLGARNGSEDLKSLTALIIQSYKLGASMGDTLRAHASMLRIKRRQRAEEAARKLPIKCLIPLATLLLPPLFVVVLGPAFMRFAGFVEVLTNR